MHTAINGAKFAIIDVETTGLDPMIDRIVEIACVVNQDGQRLETFTSLVNPRRQIPSTASAVHHITDRDVCGAPTIGELEPILKQLTAGAVVVAHNASFDLGFLPFLASRPSLCTMRLAMRVILDAPNYKNQVLRYHLGIDDLPADVTAHRALGDIEVTSRILEMCLTRYLQAGGVDDVAELLSYMKTPHRLMALPFGKHRGVDITHVPTDYLRWLARAGQRNRDRRSPHGNRGTGPSATFVIIRVSSPVPLPRFSSGPKTLCHTSDVLFALN